MTQDVLLLVLLELDGPLSGAAVALAVVGRHFGLLSMKMELSTSLEVCCCGTKEYHTIGRTFSYVQTPPTSCPSFSPLGHDITHSDLQRLPNTLSTGSGSSNLRQRLVGLASTCAGHPREAPAPMSSETE